MRRNNLLWFLFGLVILMVVFIAIYANIYNSQYSTTAEKVDFWKDFNPKVLATGFGTMASGIFAVGFWIWQKKDEDRYKREKLISNLKFEIDKNIAVLNKNVFILDKEWDSKETEDAYLEFIGKLIDMEPLRKAAVENFLKSENIVLVNLPELEQMVDSLNKYIKVFNEYVESTTKYNPAIRFLKPEAIRSEIRSLRMSVRSGYDRNKNTLENINKEIEEMGLKKQSF